MYFSFWYHKISPQQPAAATAAIAVHQALTIRREVWFGRLFVSYYNLQRRNSKLARTYLCIQTSFTLTNINVRGRNILQVYVKENLQGSGKLSIVHLTLRTGHHRIP